MQRGPANPARPGREQRYRVSQVCRGDSEVPRFVLPHPEVRPIRRILHPARSQPICRDRASWTVGHHPQQAAGPAGSPRSRRHGGFNRATLTLSRSCQNPPFGQFERLLVVVAFGKLSAKRDRISEAMPWPKIYVTSHTASAVGLNVGVKRNIQAAIEVLTFSFRPPKMQRHTHDLPSHRSQMAPANFC